MVRIKTKNKINVRVVNYDWIMKNCNKDDIMSCPETAAYTGLSLTNIYKKIEYDEIPCLKIQDMAGKIIFLKSEVNEILPRIQITKKYQTNPNPRNAAAVLRKGMQNNWKISPNAPVEINVNNKNNKTLFQDFLDYQKTQYTNKGTYRGIRWMFNKILKYLFETDQIDGELDENVLMGFMENDNYIKNTSGSTRRTARLVINNFLNFKKLKSENPLLTYDDIFINYGYKDNEKYKIYKAANDGKFGKKTLIRPFGKSYSLPAYYKDAIEDFLTSPDIETRYKPDIFKTKEELEQTEFVSNYCKSRSSVKTKYQSKIYASKAIITDIKVHGSKYLAQRVKEENAYILHIYLDPIKAKYSRINTLPSFRIAIHDKMKTNATLELLLRAIKDNVIFTTDIDYIKEKLINQKIIVHFYKHKKKKNKSIKYLNFFNINDTEKLNVPNNQPSMHKEKDEDIIDISNKPPFNNLLISDEIINLKKELEQYKTQSFGKDHKIGRLIKVLTETNKNFVLINEHINEIYKIFFNTKKLIDRTLKINF